MKHISADLTTTHLAHIAHGCNAQSKMGSGVAKAIRAKWPEAYTAYVKGLEGHSASGVSPLGRDLWVHVDDGTRIIHNLITQEYYGRDGSKFARYIHIIDAINDIFSTFWEVKQIAISRVGCSLGGLKWEIVEELLLEMEESRGIEFFVYHINLDPDGNPNV